MLFENPGADRQHNTLSERTPPLTTTTVVVWSPDNTPPLTAQTEWYMFQQQAQQQQQQKKKQFTDTRTMVRDISSSSTTVVRHGAPRPPPPSYPGEDRNAGNNLVSNASNAGVGEWTKCELLGRGAHGKVYRGVLGATGESIAVKQIQIRGMGRSELQAAENELRMVPLLRHPNVVRFLGIEQVEEHLNIFLEYLDGGCLRRHLEREGFMSEDETAHISREVLTGLSYLHSQGITHRDIKGANVLLSNDGAVKLADFGTSKCVEQESVVSGIKGTPHWMAPEVIRGQESPDGWFQADVWSVGCTVVEMLTGKMPWPDMPNAMAAMFNIANGEPPPMSRRVSAEARSFIAACCVPDPKQRYTVERLMNHPFLARERPSPPPPPLRREGVVLTGHSTPPSDETPFPSSRSRSRGGERRMPDTRVRMEDPAPAPLSHPSSCDFSDCTPFNSSSLGSSGGSNGGGGDSGNAAETFIAARDDRVAEGVVERGANPVGTDTKRPPCRSRVFAGVMGEQQQHQHQQQRWWSRGGVAADRDEGEEFAGGWHQERPADRWGGEGTIGTIHSGAKASSVVGVAGLETMQSATAGGDSKYHAIDRDSPSPVAAGGQSAGRARLLTRLPADNKEEQQQQQRQIVQKQQLRRATSDQYALPACGRFRNTDSTTTTTNNNNNSIINNSTSNDFAATSTPSPRSSGCPSPPLRQPRPARPLSTSLIGNVSAESSYCSEVVDSPAGGAPPPPPYGSLLSSCGAGVGGDGVGRTAMATGGWTSPCEGGLRDKLETAVVVAEATRTTPSVTPKSALRQQQQQQQRQRQEKLCLENHSPCLTRSDSCSSHGQSTPAFDESWSSSRFYEHHQLRSGRNSIDKEEEAAAEEVGAGEQEEEEGVVDSTEDSMSRRVTKFDSFKCGNISFDSPTSIPTSPVSSFRRKLLISTRRPSGLGSEMRKARSTPGSSTNLRRLAGYNSPFAVVQAARDQIEQESAGQTRPDDPITGEYININMDRRRNLQDSIDSSPPACSAAATRGTHCWRSNSTPVSVMRTKSAGVLGASTKLPPLERDASRGGGGGPGGGTEGRPFGGGFGRGGAMRLITSAPTFIESKSASPATPTAVHALVAEFGNRSGHRYGDLSVDHYGGGGGGGCGGGAAATTPSTVDPGPREVTAGRGFHRPLSLAPIRTDMSPSSTPMANTCSGRARASAKNGGGRGGGGERSNNAGGAYASISPSSGHFSGSRGMAAGRQAISRMGAAATGDGVFRGGDIATGVGSSGSSSGGGGGSGHCFAGMQVQTPKSAAAAAVASVAVASGAVGAASTPPRCPSSAVGTTVG